MEVGTPQRVGRGAGEQQHRGEHRGEELHLVQPDSRSSSPYGPPPSPVSTRTIGVVTQAAAAAPTMPMRSAIRIGTTNSRYVYGPWRSGEKIV